MTVEQIYEEYVERDMGREFQAKEIAATRLRGSILPGVFQEQGGQCDRQLELSD